MANVSIEINNREFLIACSHGDEEKVRMLGKKFSERVMNIKGKVGDLDQQRLFLLAGILAEEENLELTDDLGLEEMTSVLKSIKDKIDDNI